MSASSQPESDAATLNPTALPANGKPEVKDSRWLVLGVGLFLAAMVWLVFGQTLQYEFVNYDDDVYVYNNPAVTQGLTVPGIVWAFTHVHSSNWHPLTWISHMLDCQIYGLNAGGHHLTNVLLHTATVILLFLALRRMTGYLWRSAFVAAVFAIHPLRVESVAWVAERKDVLSGLFFMLTLFAYTCYAQRRSRVESRASSAGSGSLAPGPRPSTFDYSLVLLFFALGLMSKPMLVTVPLVLLLLDYWPLKRFPISDFRFPILRLVWEKLPLFGLAVASGVVTVYAQRGAIQPLENISLPLRVGNALIACVAYLGQMFWPTGLAVLYPFPAAGIGVLEVVLSLAVLAGITAGVIVLGRRCPWFLTGWLWYLIMLLPVIGIIQVGAQARADRYTYLPQIGLYLMLTWAAAELCAGGRHRRVLLGGGATVILAALIFCARPQASYWRNSETLWTHTLACTSDNFFAHGNLGNALFQKGRVDEVIVQYQQALRIKPDNAEAHYNLGNAFLQTGQLDEAIIHFQKVLQFRPDFAEAHYNLGNAFLQKGQLDEAIVHFQKALEINPDNAEACYNLGLALFQKGRVDEAIAQYQRVLQIKPDDEEARQALDSALFMKGSAEAALTRYQKALQIKPDAVEGLNNLAWLLATCPDGRIRDGVRAVHYAERACELTHYRVTLAVGTLAAAYAEAGRYDDALAAAQKACALAAAAGEADLLKKNQELLELYRAHQPYHEAAEKIVPAAPQEPE